jgi:chromosome segregation ATPase
MAEIDLALNEITERNRTWQEESDQWWEAHNRDMARIEARFHQLDQNIEAARRAQAESAARMTAALDEIRESNVHMHAELDDMHRRMAVIETRVGAIERRVGALETRVDAIVRRVGAAGTRIGATADSLSLAPAARPGAVCAHAA